MHTHRIIADEQERSPTRARNNPDYRRELKVYVAVSVVYVCMYSNHIKQRKHQLGKVANPVHGQINREISPRPRSRLIIWFRETGLAVLSRVSLVILHAQAASGAYLRGSSRCPRRRPFIFTTTRRRVSPELIGSSNCVPMMFTAESLLAQGQKFSR